MGSGSFFLFAVLHGSWARAPEISSPEGSVQGHSRQLFPESFLWTDLQAGAAVTPSFSALMSGFLQASVSSRLAFKFDPRRNFKANFLLRDVYETCRCLCYYSAIQHRGAVSLVTTRLCFPWGPENIPLRRLQSLGMTCEAILLLPNE